jgi:carboxylesterase type B
MQIMAYGAKKPVPFQQAICESQALEPGITGNFTIDAMEAVVYVVGCNTTNLHSKATVSCLRSLDAQTLLNASISTFTQDIAHNIGDIWLPTVDGDFLPEAPSTLIRQGRFADVTTMIGWTQDDVTVFTDTTIMTPSDTDKFISSYVPSVTTANINTLLGLYPVSDFSADPSANLSSEFYRTARIFRDIIMTCQPIGYAEAIARRGNDVFLYNWNQTILDPIIASLYGESGIGTVHTSEFAYIFGNLSHYNTSGFPFAPTKEDYALQHRGSRSWSTFAAVGKPGLRGHDTFQGFLPAFSGNNQVNLFVVGGPNEGISAIDGPRAKPEVSAQRLRERCAFINSPEMIEQLRY